ncbi:sensor domain-containing diguanylate cyclase [Vibrio vulnificus]|uniref:diguanylate cyclase domain-containing protein n=1 Tax=Vibrio vulnificus TaxID=672 RepID=UPI00102350F6|nr:sensor domain-containing diguanylate cyclase [Vibrio vulnificus]EGR0749875.1 sensor domain-containing diguanylate cyclase [Vibrio vulnificus]EGR7975781.1 sensor domain-containing diguanylate cyclase [Vibrio vulnificus]ELV8703700.1 sensor domain-containing diguanylate cyclase [Vibrio vulnificus]MCU8109333.1 sensor domain-containing diguanylate cyclase [Vibrio vulnificus]RZP98587.1 sensor domain-containing diguanylate cyclase [Vibrio vulnificus]
MDLFVGQPVSVFSTKWLRRHSASLIAFVATLVVTAVFLFVAAKIQQRYTTTMFNNLAQRQAESLREFVQNDLDYIGSGANFFYSVAPEDWERFEVFARHTVASSKSLIGLQWMQKVYPDQLEQHIAHVRETFPNFIVFTVPKDGPKTEGYVFSDGRPIYIASDIYPRSEKNIELLGFYSARVRFELILDDIFSTGRANVSDKVRLLQDGYDRSLDKTGLLVYHPVFDQRRETLLGVVVGVIRSTVYFEELVTKTATELSLVVRVTDLGFDAEDDPILYQSPRWSNIKGAVVSKVVSLPNRDWQVEFKLERSLSKWDRAVLMGIVVIGLIMASLVAHVVNLQTREKQRLNYMLNEKTKELQFMVDHDSLTQLLNRRAFRHDLTEMIDKQVPFSLIGFDVDHFKQINDQYGHLGGDEVLVEVARMISALLQEGDRFYRFGGDEFGILSSVTQPKELSCYLESIREGIEITACYYQETPIHCTLSIGAAIHKDEDVEELIQRMDIQLYRSKNKGRNCVTIAG